MLIRLFDIENDTVIPTEHCYTLKALKDIMEKFPDQYLKIYQYLFYMTCPSPDLNPFFHTPEIDKEPLIMQEIEGEFSTEDDDVWAALKFCQKMYETPTSRAYKGISAMLDRLGRYMEITPIEHGRDGNINSMVNAAAKFEQIRSSFKGAYKDLQEEQQSSVRGGYGLGYDQ
jgi:hypothetical protein|tara:strand:+ start:763 stop:1278 length:516 start_codon:yes stop_codon:yes gene_type:complete